MAQHHTDISGNLFQQDAQQQRKHAAVSDVAHHFSHPGGLPQRKPLFLSGRDADADGNAALSGQRDAAGNRRDFLYIFIEMGFR